MGIVQGSAHCKDCGILFWEKDLRNGICYDCFIKRVKKQPTQPLLIKDSGWDSDDPRLHDMLIRKNKKVK